MPFRCSLAFENSFFEEEMRQFVYGKGRNAYRIIFTMANDTVQREFDGVRSRRNSSKFIPAR